MRRLKVNAGICARLSFALSLLFCILFFTTPVVIRLQDLDRAFPNAVMSAWVLSILTIAAVAFVLGIITVWKGDREKLSDKDKRMAKGGLVLAGVFLLFAIASIIGGKMSMADYVPSDIVCCTSEIKLRYLALQLYNEEHGFFPAPSELEEIVNREFPMNETRKMELKLLEEQCPGHHFIYWRPQVSDMNQHIPLLADAEPYHKGKHFGCFLDGEHGLLSPEELEAIIPKR